MAGRKRKVGKRGQVTIPKDLRTRKGIEHGDELVFVERDDEIVIQPQGDEERLAEGYRKRAERARTLADEMGSASREATDRLGDAPGWSERGT